MISVRLDGRLGNQMFQYAAAYSLARRQRLPMQLDYFVGKRSQINSLLFKRSRSDIENTFPRTRNSALTVITSLIGRKRHSRQIYSPPVDEVAGIGAVERYSSDFETLSGSVELSGYFQSPKYFEAFSGELKEIFTPNTSVIRSCVERVSPFIGNIDDWVAVHVRRTDYLKLELSANGRRGTWALDADYYHSAISLFPGKNIALFSDSPESAGDVLPVGPAWISRNASPIEDLWTFSLFKNKILANSSFSWWAGFLSDHDPASVVAPQYHLGRSVGVWFPKDIQNPGWSYV